MTETDGGGRSVLRPMGVQPQRETATVAAVTAAAVTAAAT
jgi:hypothetical protein